MSVYSSLNKKRAPFSPSGPIDGRPRDAIKKMAVLFTDIVGSSQVFRSWGDIAGREMLKRHQKMASPPITEHGGVLVKMLGDSVMAYFLDAREALKSAIKIQERFKKYNQDKNVRDQIHIRLGIHSGEGIVEEDDIFGDVVNMAAKFLPLVKGDQIVISQEVYDQIQGVTSIRLEAVDTSETRSLPESLTIYKVIWDESVNLNPLMKTLAYFKPLFKLGKRNFEKTWANFLAVRDNFWEGRVEKEVILSDKSIVLIVSEAASSLTLAKVVMEFLKTNLGRDADPFVPVQIVIDTGVYLRVGELVLDDLKVNWEEIKPGEIYVSATAYHFIKQGKGFSISPPPDTAGPDAFYRIGLNDQEEEGSLLFLYQNALVQGEYTPCFYCGDKRHPTGNCPSKMLTEITQGLSHLGYLSLEEINNLYFNYLNEALPGVQSGRGGSRDPNGPTQWAYHGFFELKTVYQLRLFRTVWNARDEDWNRIRERNDDRGKGGLVWIGLDCIRVSNLEQAQSILADALKKTPHDYKVHCALAFLNIEKNDLIQARYHLMKALEQTMTVPQKIFVLFLLSRVYDLRGDGLRAEDTVRKILHLSPYCYEAVYQDIRFKFRKGKEAVALHQLFRLIKKNREYYLHALIDPELAGVSEMIHKELRNLLNETRKEAGQTTERAKQELGKIKKWLNEDEKEVMEAESLWAKIEEQSQRDSYFGYQDIIHFGTTIINMGLTGIEQRRRNLTAQTKELRYRTERYLSYVGTFPYKSLIGGADSELKQVYHKVDRDWDEDQPAGASKFREAFALAKEINSDLDRIEQKLQKLDVIRRALRFAGGFFRRSLIFQSGNLLVGIILFPILAYYLNIIIPGFKIAPQNIWDYQKTLLILGAISALLLAVFTTPKGTPRR